MTEILEPASLPSERAIIGYLLNEPEKSLPIISELSETDFTAVLNRRIITCLKDIAYDGVYDISRVIDYLQAKNYLPDGPVGIMSLASARCSTPALTGHVDNVKDCSILRKVVKANQEITEQSINRQITGPEAISSLSRKIFEASDIGSKGAYLRLPTLDNSERRVQQMFERNLRKIIHTGLANLDQDLLEGFLLKHISVWASRPGMGKSTLRKIIARNLCKAGFGVLDISTEQAEELESDKMNSHQTAIPYETIFKSSSWADDDPRWAAIIRAEQELSSWNYASIANRNLEVSDLWEILYRVKASMPLHVVFIDLFDRFTDVNVEVNKPQRVSNRLGMLAQMAEKFNVHFCINVQISRAAETGSDRRPKLGHLKDSGAYEEFARHVIFLYREAYYSPDTVRDICELNIAKQNNGPAGVGVIHRLSCRMDICEMIPLLNQPHGIGDENVSTTVSRM